MNRSETQLLVENWRILLKKSEEDFILEEALMKNLGMAAIGMICSVLGGMADVKVASAMPPRKIADALDKAFDQKMQGAFEITEDEDGNVVATQIKTGKKQLILTPEQCDNISSSELQKAINKLHDEGYSKYKEELMKAAAKLEVEEIADQTPAKRSLVERINSIDDKEIEKIIGEFEKDEEISEAGEFNLELMSYQIAAPRVFKKDPAFKKYKSDRAVIVYYIMKNNRKYRSYLPQK